MDVGKGAGGCLEADPEALVNLDDGRGITLHSLDRLPGYEQFARKTIANILLSCASPNDRRRKVALAIKEKGVGHLVADAEPHPVLTQFGLDPRLHPRPTTRWFGIYVYGEAVSRPRKQQRLQTPLGPV